MIGKVVSVALVAIHVMLPRVDASESFSCGPFQAKNKKCEYTLAKGDKFVVDCSDSTTKTIPTTLLSGSPAGAKVCSETKLRTDVKADCGSEVTAETLKKKNVTLTSASNKVTIVNTDYKEKTDLILSGSCSDNADFDNATKSGYFNVTVKKSDANSSHHIRVVLAVTGMALLGLTAF